MANPLFNGAGNAATPAANPTISNSIKSMMSMLNAAQNPNALLQQLAGKNPQFAQVMQLCKGKNPKDVFYSMCKQKGVNPNDILNQIQ